MGTGHLLWLGGAPSLLGFTAEVRPCLAPSTPPRPRFHCRYGALSLTGMGQRRHRAPRDRIAVTSTQSNEIQNTEKTKKPGGRPTAGSIVNPPPSESEVMQYNVAQNARESKKNQPVGDATQAER